MKGVVGLCDSDIESVVEQPADIGCPFCAGMASECFPCPDTMAGRKGSRQPGKRRQETVRDEGGGLLSVLLSQW